MASHRIELPMLMKSLCPATLYFGVPRVSNTLEDHNLAVVRGLANFSDPGAKLPPA